MRKGKKEAFDTVDVDDSPISSTGIFHVKLRRLDSFLEYFVSKSHEESNIIEKYAELNNLDINQTKEYLSLWEKVKNQMVQLGKSYKII